MSKQLEVDKKIFDWEGLRTQVGIWKDEGKKIVFTNGCFDLLHRGHVDYLVKAADLGDVLVLGLNSDASVSRLKGPQRPVQDEQSRLHILASLAFVDAVVLFDEATPFELITLVQPDVLVKGSDYKPEEIVGFDIVNAKGGTVKTIDFIEGYSSSLMIKKIKEGSD